MVQAISLLTLLRMLTEGKKYISLFCFLFLQYCDCVFVSVADEIRNRFFTVVLGGGVIYRTKLGHAILLAVS